MNAVIDIQTDKIKRLANRLQIFGADFLRKRCPRRARIIRINAVDSGIQKPVIAVEMMRLPILVVRGKCKVRQFLRRLIRIVINPADNTAGGDTDTGVRCALTNHLHGHTVSQHQMMPGFKLFFNLQAQSGCMSADTIAQTDCDLRFIEREIVLDSLPEMPNDYLCVFAKVFCGLWIDPTAVFLQRLGQIPVIECHPRLNTARDTAVDHFVIVGESCFIDIAMPFRQNA